MIKQSFKQAWNLILQERLFSLIYIIGTGLSVTMVMVLSIILYLKVADIYPETNRHRILVAKSGMVTTKGENHFSSSYLSENMINTCFSSLEGVEALGITFGDRSEFQVQPEGKQEQLPVAVRFVNHGFWTVFPFHFEAGQPFTEADQQSGLLTAVIAESLSMRLFGTTDAVGRYVSLNFRPHRVCGVVKDASLITGLTYAQLYIPYTASSSYKPNESGDRSGALGSYKAYLLVAPGTDRTKVKQAGEAHVKRYSQTLGKYELSLLGQPDYYWQSVFRYGSNRPFDFGQLLIEYGLLFLLLLLVPAVSLSGMADSRMERRLAEMGVRRAFGAPVGKLMRQIVAENFLFTLLGGLFGLLLSYLLIYVGRDWVLEIGSVFTSAKPQGADVLITPSMLINYQVFGITLFVCFLLNLLSALIPAWQASHRPIVHSLNA